MQVTSWNIPYVGRIAVGKVTRGTLVSGMQVSLCKRYDQIEKHKIKQLMIFDGLESANVDQVRCGDILQLSSASDGFEIDTIADYEKPGSPAAIFHRRAYDEHAVQHQQPPFSEGRKIRDFQAHQVIVLTRN